MNDTGLTPNARIKFLLDHLFEGHQNNFAHAIQVNKGTVSRWITGKTAIYRHTLVKMAETFEGRVNKEWLIDGRGAPFGEPQAVQLSIKEGHYYAGEQEQTYNPPPPAKKPNKQNAKELIRLYLQKKIENSKSNAEAAKRELKELDEIGDMEEFLGLCD